MPVKFHGGTTRFTMKRLDRMKVAKVINNNFRVLFNPKGPKGGGNGFDFAVVNFHSCKANDKDEWIDPSCDLTVDVVVEGTALYDGVRHIFWNTRYYHGDDSDEKINDEYDDLGYLYYPEIESIAKALMALRDIERSYCADPE